MYANPARSSLADQVPDFPQERKDTFTLTSGPKILLVEDEHQLTKLVFPCAWILMRLRVKTSAAGTFLTSVEYKEENKGQLP